MPTPQKFSAQPIPLPGRLYFRYQHERARIRRQLRIASKYLQTIEAVGAPHEIADARALVTDTRFQLRRRSRRLRKLQRAALDRLVAIANARGDDTLVTTWLLA